MAVLFTSTRLKIERADHHISDLGRQLTAFATHQLDTAIHQRDDGQLVITLTVLEPPPGIALAIGDAVHNLWSAMDHLAWEVVGLDGGCQHDQLYFPKGHDRESYEASCSGIKTPSAHAKQLFKSLEAFPGGVGHTLYVVRCLDNADKHTTLTPVVNAPSIDDLVFVSDHGKARRALSELYGSKSTLRAGETFAIDGAPIGASLDFKKDTEIAPHILFGNVRFVQNKPVFPTLQQLSHATASAVDVIAREFTSS